MLFFKCRLVAMEFSTGAQHAGRIDTLALSEDNNPVIIEYKTVESSDLITQSLFYLAWIPRPQRRLPGRSSRSHLARKSKSIGQQ